MDRGPWVKSQRSKTKVMVFRPSWQMRDEQFYYNGNRVEIVNTFSYLELLLNYNGKFNVTQNTHSRNGEKVIILFHERS